MTRRRRRRSRLARDVDESESSSESDDEDESVFDELSEAEASSICCIIRRGACLFTPMPVNNTWLTLMPSVSKLKYSTRALMAFDRDNIDVSYLIQGAQKHVSTSVPYNSNGDTLREVIFNRACRELTPCHEDIVLLKVRTSIPFPPSD